MLNPVLVARLIRQPEKELPQLSERGVHCRVAQSFSCPLTYLVHKMLLEGNRLLIVEG
jgi:hypothetical protein